MQSRDHSCEKQVNDHHDGDFDVYLHHDSDFEDDDDDLHHDGDFEDAWFTQ